MAKMAKMENESQQVKKPTETEETEETEESKMMKRKLTHHDNDEFKTSDVYLHIVGDKPRRFLQDFFGNYYTIVHSFFVVAVGYLICFVNDMSYLVIGLLIMSLDGYANVVLHNCPLSMMEEKYLEKSGIESRLEMLRTMGIMYSATNTYDIQLETIINAWTLIAGKILMLIIFRNFTKRSFI